MPGVLRINDDQAGAPIIVGASNVLINGKPCAHIGSNVAGHGPAAHAGPVLVEGSSTVFVNGKNVSRAGDSANCGHVGSPGSSNVIAG